MLATTDTNRRTADTYASSGRDLGTVERAFFGTLDAGHVALAPNAAIVHLSAQVTRSQLEPALARVIDHHPMLQQRVFDSNGQRPRFVRDPNPRVQVHVHAGSDTEALAWDLFHRELNGPPPDLVRAPLLRMHLVAAQPDLHQPDADEPQGTILVMHFVHVIFDGTSVLTFLRALLAACEQAPEGTDAGQPRCDALPAPAEQLLGNPPSPWASVRYFASMVAQGLLHRPRKLFRSGETAGYRDRQTRCVHRELSAAETESLRRLARAQETTVHGVLSAALVQVTAERLATATGNQPGWLRHGQSVSLRRYCQPPQGDEDIVCSVWGLALDLRLPITADLWQLSRQIKRDLRARMEAKQHLEAPLHLARVRPKRAWLTRFADNPNQLGRMDTTFLSNLGPAPAPPPGCKLHMTRFVVANGQHVLGSLVWMSATTVQGALNLTVAGVTPLISPNELEQVADAVVCRLRHMSDPKRAPKQRHMDCEAQARPGGGDWPAERTPST